MEKLDIKELDKTIKELTTLREQEKEKYLVGSIWKESVDAMRVCIASLEQLEIRGEKVNSARQDNLTNLRKILLNFLQIGELLGIASRSGVANLKQQLDAKISSVKRAKKQPVQVSNPI